MIGSNNLYKKEEKRSNRIFKNAIAIIACIMITIISICNASLIIPHIKAFFEGKESFSETKEAISDEYSSNDFFLKYDFVNINGLLMEISARRLFNGAIRLNNGMTVLDHEGLHKDPGKSDLGITLPRFAHFLQSMGSQFLYVQVPYKIDKSGRNLPNGLYCYLNDRTDELIQYLEANAVTTIDLRDNLGSDTSQTEHYFYKTDHHWTPEGAMYAYGIIINRLQEIDETIDPDLSNPALWEMNRKENWFLGSAGKRTGNLYAGVDPLIWYLPRFSTSMSCIIPHRKEIFKGSFKEANIRDKYITWKDYYTQNSYCVYIGGDYPLVKHLNPEAPNKKTVLILKDSFTLPLQAFLSTAFTKVMVIDPRHYTASSITEYCEWYKPDFVIMIINPTSVFRDEYAILETKEAVEESQPKGKLLLSDYDLSLDSKESNYNYATIPIEIENGEIYRFSFEQLKITEGKSKGVSILLYDATNKRTINQSHQIFDSEYSESVGDTEWVFKVPNEKADYRLLIYAGILGETKGTGIQCSGIRITKESSNY